MIKVLNRNKVTSLIAAAAVAGVFTGCGSAPATAPIIPGVVPNGIIPGPGGNCISLSAPIGFIANNIALNTNTVKAGPIPTGFDLYPQLVSGASATSITPGNPAAGYMYNSRAGKFDGSIAMNITPTSPFSATGVNTANASGVITISQNKLQLVYANSTGQIMPWQINPVQPSMPNVNSLCVSDVKLFLGYTSNRELYSGSVFLYLNGTQHGTYLSF